MPNSKQDILIAMAILIKTKQEPDPSLLPPYTVHFPGNYNTDVFVFLTKTVDTKEVYKKVIKNANVASWLDIAFTRMVQSPSRYEGRGMVCTLVVEDIEDVIGILMSCPEIPTVQNVSESN